MYTFCLQKCTGINVKCWLSYEHKSGASIKENYRKPTEVVRPCEENERGAHSETNARCGHTGEKKKRAAKSKMERCV